MTSHNTIPFTEMGYITIKKEYEDLQSKRPHIVQELTTARDMGDRSENAAYKSARRKLSQTDSRLRFLKKLVETGEVIKPTQTEYIQIGSIVTVDNGNRENTFHIVGEHEADPIQNKLSYRSPVGQALLKKRVSDVVSIMTPSGTIQYTILRITI